MYFPDLSNYSFSVQKELPNVLNIGWLDTAYEFPTAKPTLEFIEQLRAWVYAASVNPYRGFHFCRYCKPDPKSIYPERNFFTRDGKVHWLGAREVWIPSRKGVVFAAPDMIFHYVERHEYAPPKEFVDAVMDTSLLSEWDVDAEYERLTGKRL